MNCALNLDHYRAIFLRAREQYCITPFIDLDRTPASDLPKLILRHDIDSSLASAVILARCENELGIRATYFVQLHSDCYSALCLEGVQFIRQLLDLGHEIGLHFDPLYYAALGVPFKAGIGEDIKTLSTLVNRPVVSVSRHLPLLGGEKETFPDSVRYNAFDPAFINGKYKYLSDSNGLFREGCFCGHLDKKQDYCFLAHPVWWTTGGADWKEKLNLQAEQDCSQVRTRIKAKVDQYCAILARRKEHDQMFNERQSRVSSKKA